jgi:hypothetical protein
MDKYGAITPENTPALDDKQQQIKAAADCCDQELDQLADSPEQRLAKQAEQDSRR